MAASSYASLLLFLLLVFLPWTRATRIRYCDRIGDYEVKVTAVDISPDPVISGQPATFSVSATTDKPIIEGTVEINVSLYGMLIHKETHKLCGETSCPILVGDFVISHSQSLPAFTPPGMYTLKMRMVGPDGHTLTCISFTFKIQFGSSVADS
ncbi:phosphatidylglycerol/phosphatidylinositol transfer protein-like [Aristolochia californica]|uniref:phosphatidylglycerol/phosphatidylinositol transfer protein-like n=1 Tax=Aristolochia californica TaxID=171875 RepID=UPI0035DC5B5F